MADPLDAELIPSVAPIEGPRRALKVFLAFVLITLALVGVYMAIPLFMKFKPDYGQMAARYVSLPRDAKVKFFKGTSAEDVEVTFEMTRPDPAAALEEVRMMNITGSYIPVPKPTKLRVEDPAGGINRIYSYDPASKLYRFQSVKK